MTIFARIGAALKAFSKMIFGGSHPWAWMLPRTRYNYARDVGDGMGSSVIMAPVLWIARRMCESPILIQRDEDEATSDHDLIRLLKRPNRYYSGRALRWAIALSLNLDGNGYIIKVRNAQLKPIELWYVPHWLMEPHWPIDGTQYIDHYLYKPEGRQMELDPSDVIHIRHGLDPRNTRKGLAPLASLLREVFTDDEAANYTASLLRNAGVPGVLISPETDGATLDPKDAEGIKKQFTDSFGGDKRGEPMVMSLKTKVVQFGFSPKDLDLGALRDIPEERVTAVLGIPAAVVGFGTGLQQTKVGATMAEMREMGYEDCIIPLQQLMSEELESQLLPDFEERPDEWHILYDLSDVRVLQEDRNKLFDRTTRAYQGGLITRGEARTAIGEQAEPADEFYLQSMVNVMVPKGQIVPPPIEEKAWLRPYLKAASRESQFMTRLWTDWLRLSEIQTRGLRKTFEELGEEAATAWEKIARDRGIETLGAIRPRTKAIDDLDLYAELISETLDLGKRLDYAPHFLMVAKKTYGTINAVFGLGVDLAAPAEGRIISAGGIRKGLVDLDGQTRSAVFDALSQAREAGEGVLEASRRIRDMVPAGPWADSETRSIVIARTETKYAQNVSSLEAYRSSDSVTGVQIIDGQLDTSCEECIALNGDIVSIEEAERLVRTEHPNGTRSFSPVIGEKALSGDGGKRKWIASNIR